MRDMQQVSKVQFTISAEEQTQVDALMHERRMQFSAMAIRVLGIIFTIETVLIFLLWLLFARTFPQVLIGAIMLGLIALLSWAYPWLARAGYGQFGINLVLASFLFLLFAASLLDAVMLPTSAMCFLFVSVLSISMLGSRGSIWVTVVSIIAFMADVVLQQGPARSWFEPLDPAVAFLAGIMIGSLALIATAFILRQIVLGQEGYLRQSELAALEIDRRAQAEREQGAQIQRARDEIETLAATEREQRQALEVLIGQIRDSAANLNTASEEILAATMQQMAGAAEQNASVTQTMATVEEVRATMSQTAERAQVVAGAAQQALRVAQDGQQAVTDTVEGMQTIYRQVEEIATTILALSERTQQIGEIIATVDELADQSRLLVLNASIEAARAGEEGRGFAVVAMEVRQLADQSRGATSRIGGILQEIQAATNTAVMVTEEGSKGAARGVELVGRAGEAIAQLAETIEGAAQSSTQIAASTHQQRNGMEQLAAAMAAIRQASEEAAASTRQTEGAARNLNAMSRQMEKAVERYSVG